MTTTYYEPKVGDWVLLWTGTAHRLTAVESTPVYVWLSASCGQYHCYDVDSMRQANGTDRHCQRCAKSAQHRKLPRV